jgi:outer membrane protein OmpA-like peptidoglycan-associated protein
MDLSWSRAEAVAGFLQDQGVDPVRLEAVGFGSADPVADNSTAAGRKENRRVEIVLVAGLN